MTFKIGFILFKKNSHFLDDENYRNRKFGGPLLECENCHNIRLARFGFQIFAFQKRPSKISVMFPVIEC